MASANELGFERPDYIQIVVDGLSGIRRSPTVDKDTRLEGLKYDSLDKLEAIMSVEEELFHATGKETHDFMIAQDFEGLQTVTDLAELVREKFEKKVTENRHA